MLIDIIIILLSAMVLIMTFKSDAICKKVLKTEEPSQEQVQRVKMIALVIAVIAFVVAILF